MSAIHDLDGLFVEQARRLYNSEQRLLNELPAWIAIATAFDLETLFADELKRALIRSQRLEEIGVELDVNITGAQSLAIAALIEETRSILDSTADPDARDVIVVAAVRRMAHTQMAGYRALRDFARELGYMYVYDLLRMCVDELDQSVTELGRMAEGGFMYAGLNEQVQI